MTLQSVFAGEARGTVLLRGRLGLSTVGDFFLFVNGKWIFAKKKKKMVGVRVLSLGAIINYKSTVNSWRIVYVKIVRKLYAILRPRRRIAFLTNDSNGYTEAILFI